MGYEIGKPTGRCAASGREFQPGEEFISALCETPLGLRRQDFSLEHWPGQMKNAIGFWHQRMPQSQPESSQSSVVTTNEILAWFDELENSTELPVERRDRLRYVAALLLVRRKALKLQDVERTAAGEFLVLKRTRSSAVFKVRDPGVSEDAIFELERELTGMLERASAIDSREIGEAA